MPRYDNWVSGLGALAIVVVREKKKVLLFLWPVREHGAAFLGLKGSERRERKGHVIKKRVPATHNLRPCYLFFHKKKIKYVSAWGNCESNPVPPALQPDAVTTRPPLQCFARELATVTLTSFYIYYLSLERHLMQNFRWKSIKKRKKTRDPNAFA